MAEDTISVDNIQIEVMPNKKKIMNSTISTSSVHNETTEDSSKNNNI